MNAEGPLAHLREHQDVIDSDLSIMRAHLPSGARVLDVGAGRGAFVVAARRAGFDALGLEMQPQAVHLWGREGVPGCVGSGARAPFADTSFSLVRMKEVIEHVEDPLSLMLEARRLLVPGGLVIAHTPTPYSQFYPIGNFWDDYTHIRPFSRVGLQRLVADAGLDLERIDAYVSGRNTIERVAGKLLARVFPHIYRVIARRPE